MAVADHSWDPIWQTVFGLQSWGRYPSEAVVRFVAGNFYNSPRRVDTRILEVGCGPGANIWYLSREGFDVHGIDASSLAIDLASKQLHAEGLNATLRIGDIIALPYPDGFFDGVIDCECLCTNSATNTRSIAGGIWRVLKKGGAVLLSDVQRKVRRR